MTTREVVASAVVGALVAACLLALAALYGGDVLPRAAPAAAPTKGPLFSLEEPVVASTADGNGHAVRADVAIRLAPESADWAEGDAPPAGPILRDAVTGAIAATSVAQLAGADGRREFRRKVRRRLARQGDLTVQSLYVTQMAWQ